MKTKEAKSFKLSPADYRETIKEIELKSISMIDCSAKLNPEQANPNMKVSIQEDAVLKKLGEDEVDIFHTYKMDVRSEDAPQSFVFLNATFKVRFANASKMTGDAFDIYKTINLPILTLPYFREFVSNITARMNIAPITLPFVKRG
jgi:preprotein translocase subunit SecB